MMACVCEFMLCVSLWMWMGMGVGGCWCQLTAGAMGYLCASIASFVWHACVMCAISLSLSLSLSRMRARVLRLFSCMSLHPWLAVDQGGYKAAEQPGDVEVD